jgi:hypothetical protein
VKSLSVQVRASLWLFVSAVLLWFPLSVKLFFPLISQMAEPGPNKMLRPEFPQVHGWGGAKAAGLNHCTPCWWVESRANRSPKRIPC